MTAWIDAQGTPGLASVVIPTYNRAGLLSETLASVLAQTYGQVEVLVVDDGSGDNTLEVLESWRKRFDDERGWVLTPLTQKNSGSPAARNAGIRASRGEHLAFLDDDDLLSADFLAGRVRTATDSGADIVYGPSVDFAVEEGGFGLRKQRNEQPPGTGRTSLEAWLRGDCFWYVMSALFTRAFAAKAGPWNEGLRRHEDLEFLARCFRHGPRIVHCPDGFLCRRVHPQTKSRDERKLGSGKQAAYEDNVVALATAIEEHALAAPGPAAGIRVALAQHLGDMAAKNYERGLLRAARHCAQRALAHDPHYRPEAKWSSRLAYALGGFRLWGAKNRLRRALKRSQRHAGLSRNGFRFAKSLPGCRTEDR